jgi:hypothetical protein
MTLVMWDLLMLTTETLLGDAQALTGFCKCTGH